MARARDPFDGRDRTPDKHFRLAFYGALEQVLTGWIFGVLDQGEPEFELAKRCIVETICGGLEA